MRRLGLILCTCLLAGCGSAGASPTTDDLQDWQGTWNMVSCICNGEPEQADAQWIVDGERYVIRLDGRTGTDPYHFKLDPSQKRIDMKHHDTPKGTYGGTYTGIYEITGNSLKVCYDLKGERYPKSLAAGHGSGQVLYQFQRVR